MKAWKRGAGRRQVKKERICLRTGVLERVRLVIDVESYIQHVLNTCLCEGI